MNHATRVLALDLDDTLLRSDKSVSAVNLAAMERWLGNGHEIVVATGRPPRSVPPVLPDLLRHAPRIVYNGAQTFVGDEIIDARPLPTNDVLHMLEWAESSGETWYIGLEIDDTLYVNRNFAKPGHFEVADLMQLYQQPTYKMVFFFPEGRGDIAPLLAAVPPSTRALVTPKFDIVQLCAGNADKSTALDYLLKQRGRSLDSAVAIGDDINDVEMVRCSGVGIAVENALPEVKAVADWIAPDNDADGVAFAIDRLLA